jgi:hypothetical protein
VRARNVTSANVLFADSGHRATSAYRWFREFILRMERAAKYWTLANGNRKLTNVAWSYPQPLAGAEALAGHLAFYPHHLTCTVGCAPVMPQPGGFYGGWITPELVGPFKGERGSEGW